MRRKYRCILSSLRLLHNTVPIYLHHITLIIIIPIYIVHLHTHCKSVDLILKPFSLKYNTKGYSVHRSR